VFDLDEPVRHELNEKVSKSTGFEVLYHKLEFMGICKECQGRNRYAAIAGRY
jgi:Fur family peroxide stress response transcriptional regulator